MGGDGGVAWLWDEVGAWVYVCVCVEVRERIMGWWRECVRGVVVVLCNWLILFCAIYKCSNLGTVRRGCKSVFPQISTYPSAAYSGYATLLDTTTTRK
jgi:hypothetical protein